jgi:hypothetical protein
MGTVTEVNQVFAMTRLHQSQLGIVVLYLSLILLVDQDISWWRKHLDRVLLLLPFVSGLFLWMVHTWPMDYFLEIVKEDQVIENGQFFVLFIGGLVSAYFTRQAWLNGKRDWQIYLMMVASFGLFLIAGDEISWGQRIFGLVTPESLLRINRQGEITFHNTHYVEGLVGMAYLTLALLGAAARPLLQLIFGKKSQLAAMAPTAIFIGYFIFPSFYHGYSLTTEFGVWREWSEPIELCLYAGLSFWIVYLGKSLMTKKA